MGTLEQIIKKRLAELNMTATELAKEMGLNSHTPLNKIYNRNSARYDTLVKMADVLKLSVDDLYQATLQKDSIISNVKNVRVVTGMKYKELPFVPVSARATFVRSLNSDIPIKLETFEVLIIDEEENLDGQIVFEIDGDSMEPNYYTRMKVRAKKVYFNDWVYISNGVYIVHYAH